MSFMRFSDSYPSILNFTLSIYNCLNIKIFSDQEKDFLRVNTLDPQYFVLSIMYFVLSIMYISMSIQSLLQVRMNFTNELVLGMKRLESSFEALTRFNRLFPIFGPDFASCRQDSRFQAIKCREVWLFKYMLFHRLLNGGNRTEFEFFSNAGIAEVILELIGTMEREEFTIDSPIILGRRHRKKLEHVKLPNNLVLKFYIDLKNNKIMHNLELVHLSMNELDDHSVSSVKRIRDDEHALR